MPRRAVSNIAWPAAEDDRALGLVRDLGFAGVEVAPLKILGALDREAADRAHRYREALASRGLTICALQGVMFGLNGASLFGDAASIDRFRDRLLHIAEIAEAFGAGACVFGAPLLRDPGDLGAADASRHAAEILRPLGEAFAARGVTLCIEANPAAYGCRFLTRTDQAAEFVAALAHEGIRLQLDTGTMLLNDEPEAEIAACAALIGHAHVSQPFLQPLGEDGERHGRIGAALAHAAYDGWISIEMKETADWEGALRRAHAFMSEHYRGTGA